MSITGRVLPIVGMMALVGCGGGQIVPMGAKGHYGTARLLFKSDGSGGCKLRTTPKVFEILVPDEDEVVWDIKDNGKCLDDKDLVIKWGRNNPTVCTEVTTKANGNKSQIKCDLVKAPTPGTYPYTLYFRDLSGDKPIADPDIEIVMF